VVRPTTPGLLTTPTTGATNATGAFPFANATQGFAQNFNNYMSIPIGAQYNPNVMGGQQQRQVQTTPTGQSAGLTWGLNNGMTQQQIDKNIFDFVNNNRNLSDTQLRNEMDKYGISPGDVARATGVDVAGVQSRYDASNVAGGSPYSQVMAQMRPVGNPYAGVLGNQAMGGYNPALYDQLLTSEVAKTAPDLVNPAAQQYAQSQLGMEQSSTGGMAHGGMVHGGLMFGMNPPGPDDGAVNLDMGEYVIKKSSVNKYGRGLLDMINEGKVPAKKLKSLLS
jgi:hypothetical protein